MDEDALVAVDSFSGTDWMLDSSRRTVCICRRCEFGPEDDGFGLLAVADVDGVFAEVERGLGVGVDFGDGVEGDGFEKGGGAGAFRVTLTRTS